MLTNEDLREAYNIGYDEGYGEGYNDGATDGYLDGEAESCEDTGGLCNCPSTN